MSKSVPFIRELHRGSRPGSDVKAVKRALHAKGMYRKKLSRLTCRYGGACRAAVARFQRNHGLEPTGIYDRHTHDLLAPNFDAKARQLLERAAHEHLYHRLLHACRQLSAHAGPYLYGGDHGKRLRDCEPSDRFDCSSSVSKVLQLAGGLGFKGDDYAFVADQFEQRWGHAGRGRYFTIYATPASAPTLEQHVWIRLKAPGLLGRLGINAWRFDTSPWGDGGSGPRLRRMPRSTLGFNPRRWPGL